MKLETLHDLYIDELRDLHDAEHQLMKALPLMAKAASSPELKEAFEEHLEATQAQIERLEQIFDRLGLKAKGEKCEAMKGLIEEGSQMIEAEGANDVRDAGLICAAQKVEHYEIASYGCVRTYAEQLGYEEDAELLQETLDEEKETDERLTELHSECINVESDDDEESEEEEEETTR